MRLINQGDEYKMYIFYYYTMNKIQFYCCYLKLQNLFFHCSALNLEFLI